MGVEVGWGGVGWGRGLVVVDWSSFQGYFGQIVPKSITS